MMAHTCDCCKKVIEQAEYLELGVRALDPEEGGEQDDSAQAHGDYCDTCISTGAAIKHLLECIEWTLEPRP